MPLRQVPHTLVSRRNGPLQGRIFKPTVGTADIGTPLWEGTCEGWSSEIEFATLIRQLAAATVR